MAIDFATSHDNPSFFFFFGQFGLAITRLQMDNFFHIGGNSHHIHH